MKVSEGCAYQTRQDEVPPKQQGAVVQSVTAKENLQTQPAGNSSFSMGSKPDQALNKTVDGR